MNQSSLKLDFAEQLSVFQEWGFELNAGVTREDLISKWGEEAYEKEPFSLLYRTLGSTIEREPWTPITNQVWHFDTEAIEGDGSYVSILKNLERISNGELLFMNVSDKIDDEKKSAHVSFDLKGDHYSCDLVYDEDWVDPQIFTKIVELTNKYSTKGRFTYLDLGGQDAVIGYATPDLFKRLREITGLNIEWLR